MNEPTISCPHCNAEVTLTKSRTPSLIQLRQKIAEKEAEIARRESAIRAQRGELARAVKLDSNSGSLPNSRPTERGLRQRRPRRHNFCRWQILKVGHRKLLPYNGKFKNATATLLRRKKLKPSCSERWTFRLKRGF